MIAVFLDSFFSTFLLVFQGEIVLNTAIVFYDDKLTLYIAAVLGGIAGLLVNYGLGYLVVRILAPMLDDEAIAKYNKYKIIVENKILYLLPITAFGFINSVLILDGAVGNVFNVFASTVILLFASILTFFCGMFKSSFWKFLLIISVCRLAAYYYYVFIFDV